MRQPSIPATRPGRAIGPRRGRVAVACAALCAALVPLASGGLPTPAAAAPLARSASTVAAVAAPAPRLGTQAGRPVPTPLRGLTLESVDNLDAIVAAVAAHSQPPTVRIVFQDGTTPAHYAEAIRRLRPYAYLVGTVLDSTAVSEYSVAQVRARTRQFVQAFGANIDIWEIGNELNGEWLGSPASIRAKAAAEFDVVKNEFAPLHLQTAVTLNYWPSSDCYAKPWEATDSFAASLPAAIRTGVDHAWLSFYETACDPIARPSVAQFTGAFQRLAATFPHARVGFGEVGVQGIDSGFATEPTLAERVTVADRYYGMYAPLRTAVGSRFEGGYFWWTYGRDAVGANRSATLWPTLDALFAHMN